MTSRSQRSRDPRSDLAEQVDEIEAVGDGGAEPGRELLHQSGDPHLEELVEVLAHDGEELGPLEEGDGRVLREREDARDEVEERELSVQVAHADRRTGLGFGLRADGDVDAGHRATVPGASLAVLGGATSPRSPAVSFDGPSRQHSGKGLRRRQAGGIVTQAMSTDPRFAEPTPFARLVYAHAVSVAGDACLTVSLAGSLFFQNPAGAAREKVLLYLILTMAPFAIVAPVLGPMLDRSRGGRRMLVIVSALGRAAICLAMAQYVSKAAPEGLADLPARVRGAGAGEGLHDRQERARARRRQGQGRARQRQLTPGVAQRDRGHGGWHAGGRASSTSSVPTGRSGSPRSCSSSPRSWRSRYRRRPSAVRRTARTTRSPRPSCTNRASCSRAARWRCSAAAWASSRSSPRSRSRTISSVWERRWRRARSVDSPAWSRRRSHASPNARR